MHKKLIVKNFIISFMSNIVLLIMGLVIPRVFITHYGSDTNGLVTTLTQIFGYMALLEAGIGQATTVALYGPLQKKNRQEIIKVLQASRRYYQKVTYIYGSIVILLSIVLPFILKSDLSYWTIFLTVLFEGFSGVIIFYFVQTQSLLLSADGKGYIKATIELIIKVLSYGIKILLALNNTSIVYVQGGFFFLSLIKVIIYNEVMKKQYPWVSFKESKDTITLPDRGAYIITEIAWTIFSSTDLIVLSVFCSTKLSSVYSVNNLVYAAINNLLYAGYSGISYYLGKSFHENQKKYELVHDAFNSFFMSLVTITMSVAIILSPSFISLYTSGVNDINYSYRWLPLCFAVVNMLSWSRYVAGNITSIAGYAKQVSRISMIEAFLNVLFSLIFVRMWGIYGVLFATIGALPVKVIFTNYLAEKKIMKRKNGKTVPILTLNYFLLAVALVVSFFIRVSVNSYFNLFVLAMIMTFVVSIIVFSLNLLVNKQCIGIIKSTIYSLFRNKKKQSMNL